MCNYIFCYDIRSVNVDWMPDIAVSFNKYYELQFIAVICYECDLRVKITRVSRFERVNVPFWCIHFYRCMKQLDKTIFIFEYFWFSRKIEKKLCSSKCARIGVNWLNVWGKKVEKLVMLRRFVYRICNYLQLAMHLSVYYYRKAFFIISTYEFDMLETSKTANKSSVGRSIKTKCKKCAPICWTHNRYERAMVFYSPAFFFIQPEEIGCSVLWAQAISYWNRKPIGTGFGCK